VRSITAEQMATGSMAVTVLITPMSMVATGLTMPMVATGWGITMVIIIVAITGSITIVPVLLITVTERPTIMTTVALVAAVVFRGKIHPAMMATG